MILSRYPLHSRNKHSPGVQAHSASSRPSRKRATGQSHDICDRVRTVPIRQECGVPMPVAGKSKRPDREERRRRKDVSETSKQPITARPLNLARTPSVRLPLMRPERVTMQDYPRAMDIYHLVGYVNPWDHDMNFLCREACKLD